MKFYVQFNDNDSVLLFTLVYLISLDAFITVTKCTLSLKILPLKG